MAGQPVVTTVRLPLTFCVAFGSVLGASARWGLALLMHPPGSHATLAWGSLAVNVIGSLVIGLYAAITEAGGRLVASPAQRAFVMPGLCGGFTTFSLFTAEVSDSVQQGDWKLAAALVSLSVCAWLISVVVGYGIGKRINQLH
jgi:CrcB protein